MFVKGLVLVESQAISSDFLFVLKTFIEFSELFKTVYLKNALFEVLQIIDGFFYAMQHFSEVSKLFWFSDSFLYKCILI